MISLKKVDVDTSYSMYVQAYFDDEKQTWAQYADVERGCITRVAMDSQGEILLDVAGVVYEKVYGDVEIYYSR